MKVLTLLLLSSFVSTSFPRDIPTTTCLQPEVHCGDNLCCCNAVKQARCSFLGEKLWYIPTLPENTTALHISHNNIAELSKDLLKNVSSLPLVRLDLTYNNINKLQPDTFSEIKKLTTIDLSWNSHINITQLFQALGSFPRSVVLRDLRLNGISLKILSPDLFLPLNKSGILVKEIYLEHNLLNFVDIAVFRHLWYLKELHLKDSQIQNFDAVFGHSSLVAIGLSENEIARLIPTFCPREDVNTYPCLVKLDLSNNFINDLKSSAWNCLKHLQTLILTANVIREVPGNVFSKLSELKELRLNHMVNSNMKLAEHALNSASIETLTLENNDMVFKSKDIKMSYFKYCPNVTSLIMGNNRFGQVDYSNITYFLSFLTKLEYLSMVRCRLNGIPPKLFLSLQNLKYLDLDGNGISSLDGAFIGARALTTLNVEGNNIKWIGPNTFPKNFLENIRQLNLADNPFECTCKLLWFRSSIGDKGIVPGTNVTLTNWPGRYGCGFPMEEKGKRLIRYRPTEESCRESHSIYFLVSALGSLFFLTIVITPIIYRYRWYISYWIYKRKQNGDNSERQPLLYDHVPYTYVIYNDEDRGYVHGQFRYLIEDQFGFRLYIWHRDADLGAKSTVMFDAIHNSKHVIAVVSKHFMTDSWCEFQLDVAEDRQIETRKDFLTLVILEDVHKAIVRKSWCVKLTRLETVYWCTDVQDIRRKVFEQQVKEKLNASMKRRQN